MSKGEGKIVTVKFTQPITGGANPNVQSTKESQDGIWSASGTYGSTNVVERAKDGNTGTYWESRTTANYVQVDLRKVSSYLHGIKVYCGSSYRPNGYTISVSEDGVVFNQVGTGSILAQTGWQTFSLDSYYAANFIRINFGYVTRLYLYELILLVADYVGGFKLTGQERKYINGPLVDKQYAIKDVKPHPTLDGKHVQLVVSDLTRFPSIEGNMTFGYNAIIGSLVGQGGAVASFQTSFTPTDLAPEPNPHAQEYLNPVIGPVTFEWFPVEYIDAESTEQNTVVVHPATVAVSYTKIDIEIP